MSFIRGLLGKFGVEDDDQLPTPVPFNPNAPPPPHFANITPQAPSGLLGGVQARPPQVGAPAPAPAAQGLLGPQDTQPGLMGFAPNRNTPELNNPANVANANFSFEDEASAHEHGGGIRGGVRHLLGIDRMSPEARALLTGDQARRAKPSILGTLGAAILKGQGPQSLMDERSARLLGLQDKQRGRETATAQQEQWAQVQAEAAQIADPQGALEYVARRAEALGLPQGAQASLGAQRLEPPVPSALAERNIDPSSPAGISAAIAKSTGAARAAAQFGVVATVGPDGTPIFTRRIEAPGQAVVQPPLVGSALGNERNNAIGDIMSIMERAKAPLAAGGQGVSGRAFGVVPIPNWARLQFELGGAPGRDLTLLIGDLTSRVGNMRSGGAITPSEFERLEAFLPTMNDKPAVIGAKLDSFTTTLSDVLQRRGESAPAAAPSAKSDIDRALDALGEDASNADIRAWIAKNPRSR